MSRYLGLFLAALGAATLIPMQSEVLLVAVASVGNKLNSMVDCLQDCVLSDGDEPGRFVEPIRTANLSNGEDGDGHSAR
jgi:hypothetical protein